jgi:hypothetical protein
MVLFIFGLTPIIKGQQFCINKCLLEKAWIDSSGRNIIFANLTSPSEIAFKQPKLGVF